MEFFSTDYREARERFRTAEHSAGGRLFALQLDEVDGTGQPLSIDIAWLGDATASSFVIHSCGLHGVEGFSGSAVQLQLLADPPDPAPGCALLLVHVLNPYGMSQLRRVNRDNIDLNRNFIFGGKSHQGVTDGYRLLDPLLNPESPPSNDFFYLRALYYLLRYGYGNLKAAVACGQYQFPRGLFFGGKRLSQEVLLYHDWLQQLGRPERLLVIDHHTGLGRPGQESLLQSSAATPAELLSEKFGVPVCQDLQSTKVLGYQTLGSHEELYRELFPSSRVDFITHEFGTKPTLQVVQALRSENRWHHFGAGGLEHPCKQALRDAFNLPDEAWRQRVVGCGVSLIRRGLQLLKAERLEEGCRASD